MDRMILKQSIIRTVRRACCCAVFVAICLGRSTGGSLIAAADEIIKETSLGPVEVTTRLTPDNPTIGDEIQLEIRVRSPADIEVLMPEFGEALNRYTILDFVPRQQIESDGSSLVTQRYTLQPYLSGQQSIPPILIEFVDNRAGKKPSPDGADAYEILTDRIDFDVKSVLPTDASAELKPPMGKLDPPQTLSTSNWLGIALGGLAAVIALAVAGMYLYRHRQKVVRRSAYEIARKKLDRLLSMPAPETEEAIEKFFVAISAIVRKYLEDRFELHAPDLTTEEFLVVAGSSSDLTNDHQRLLRDFLRQADLVKFAGAQATGNEIRQSSDAAFRFLEETRENAPLIEVSAQDTVTETTDVVIASSSPANKLGQEEAHV